MWRIVILSFVILMHSLLLSMASTAEEVSLETLERQAKAFLDDGRTAVTVKNYDAAITAFDHGLMVLADSDATLGDLSANGVQVYGELFKLRIVARDQAAGVLLMQGLKTLQKSFFDAAQPYVQDEMSLLALLSSEPSLQWIKESLDRPDNYQDEYGHLFTTHYQGSVAHYLALIAIADEDAALLGRCIDTLRAIGREDLASSFETFLPKLRTIPRDELLRDLRETL